MKYISLNQLRYKDSDKYEAEYRKRFNSEYAIKLDLYIHGSQAFYLETNDLLKKIIEMQRIDKEIHDLVLSLPGISVKHFTKRCLIDEIVLSNNIEGVSSTRREIEDILIELGRKNKRKRFYGLVKKYYMLMTRQDIVLDQAQDIRSLYNELVLPEVIEDDSNNAPDGKLFRKDSVTVYSPSGKTLHCGVYPESEIINSINAALHYLNNSDNELLFRISVFHYLFGYIHPFYDGNGRTSRFISSYLLSQYFEPAIAFRLSYTIKENLKEYYNAFKTCNDRFNKGDITPFIYVFFEIIEKSLYQLKDALEKRLQLLDHYSKNIPILPNVYLNGAIYSLLIQAALFSDSGISTRELIEIAEISRSTLSNRLKSIDSRLINKNKIGTENYYSLNLQYYDTLIDAERDNSLNKSN